MGFAVNLFLRGTQMAKKRKPRGQWSRRDVNLLKRLFPTTATSKVAGKLRRKTDAVKKKASRMGLKKSKVYLRRIGRA
jgi:hypothetical protein